MGHPVSIFKLIKLGRFISIHWISDKSRQTYAKSSTCPNILKHFKQFAVILAYSSAHLLAREVCELVKAAGCKDRKCFIYTAYFVVEIDFIILHVYAVISGGA